MLSHTPDDSVGDGMCWVCAFAGEEMSCWCGTACVFREGDEDLSLSPAFTDTTIWETEVGGGNVSNAAPVGLV